MPCGCNDNGQWAPPKIDPGDLRVVRSLEKPEGMRLYTSGGDSVSLRGWYKDRHCFLICGGPSLNDFDLEQLHSPGCVTFGMNNSWSVWRPDLWVYVDQPGGFLDSCWKDPKIIKFCPVSHLEKNLHVRKPDGSFRKSKYKVKQMPSCFFFVRNERFCPQCYLDEPCVNWGGHSKYIDPMGIKGCRSVMLAAFKLIFYLGFSKVYLVGCDFEMKWKRDNEQGAYAFRQFGWQSKCKGNNSAYQSLSRRFAALRPRMEARGLTVFNCTPGSKLTAFPQMSFAEAVKRASREPGKVVDTEGWYDHVLPGEKDRKGRPKVSDAQKERKMLKEGKL